MKVLHTSDWHLGKATWGHSRNHDHEVALGEITAIAAAVQPDLILNTGDLFDQQRPPVQAMKLATDVLRALSAIAPVVVISGNHDSAPLLHWLHGLLRHGERVHIVADPDAVRVGTVLRLPVGDGRLHLAALPFITANRIVTVLDDPSARRKAYAAHIATVQRELLHRLHEDFDPARDVSVFAAHQYLAGSVPSRTENPNHTCDFYATDPEQIPPVDYAAFGHIHKPQDLPGRVIGAYAGSPIQLDFGEVGEAKSVVLAHLHPGNPARIERLPLHAGRRLDVVTGTLDELRAHADSITTEICRIVVHTPTHEPDLSRQIRALFPDATIVQIDENAADRKLDLITPDTPAGGEPDNVAMFSAYLAEQGTRTASADHVRELFGTLLHHSGDEHPPALPAEELLAEDLSAFTVPAEEAEAAA
ncbi:exonuclease SbcCD subunit D [Micromonospora sp. WMMD1082]|uniref:metallophosphoesterase family protein n=1 Tax=Micromonospora sp. WMMD1082 TaxID=3016104 RepID=UPI002416AE21|nr:exonuclease SbcCD subunit D [Micromonospora sp. WMMD1082]MDG4794987.1 exonuclease SbcCD subunit D [Micromonospora sp. WMMD1082]